MKLDQVQLLYEFQEKDPVSIHNELLTRGIDFSNIYQELEMSSRFVDTHMDISFGDIPVNLHSHSYHEIVYVLSNSGTQYLVGTKRYQLQRGDIIFVPPGIGHKPLFPSELAEPYKRIVLWISTDFIEGLKYIYPEYKPKFTEQVLLLRTIGTPWESIGTYFHIGLKEAKEKKEGWQFALCGNTIQLLIACLRVLSEPATQPMKSEKPELLDDVVSYIESHLHEKITLADTAQRFFVSESTIGQTFQKKMHVSFYHYVTQRRLIAAKSMITTEDSLDTLSAKVGFSDYSTFYRAFKKEFGISPKDYRKLLADNNMPLL